MSEPRDLVQTLIDLLEMGDDVRGFEIRWDVDSAVLDLKVDRRLSGYERTKGGMLRRAKEELVPDPSYPVPPGAQPRMIPVSELAEATRRQVMKSTRNNVD